MPLTEKECNEQLAVLQQRIAEDSTQVQRLMGYRQRRIEEAEEAKEDSNDKAEIDTKKKSVK